MEQNDKILIPFLQKVYSALKHLDNFSVSNDFYDNISDFDGFFSEYRSSTLVLQKSLGGNNNPIYQKNLKEFLLKDEQLSKWMNDKRVDSVHKQPFNLHKHLKVYVYSAISSEIILEKEYTIEHDESFEKLQKELISEFEKQNPNEVNFSLVYFFTEEDKTVDAFGLSMKAIKAMMAFMVAMYKDFISQDSTCATLLEKNIELARSIESKTFTFTRDYCYLPQKHQFVGGEILESNIPYYKIPVGKLYANFGVKRQLNDDFAFFVSMHSQIYLKQHQHIMPTFFVKYTDDTIAIVSFDATLRTTFYRKINEIALKVKNEEVEAVYYVTEFVTYGSISNKEEFEALIQLPYIERRKKSQNSILAFYQISKDEIKCILAEGEQINDLLSPQGVAQFKKEHDTSYHFFLTPLVTAFASKSIEENVTNE